MCDESLKEMILDRIDLKLQNPVDTAPLNGAQWSEVQANSYPVVQSVHGNSRTWGNEWNPLFGSCSVKIQRNIFTLIG